MLGRRPHTISTAEMVSHTTGAGETASNLNLGTTRNNIRCNAQPVKPELLFERFQVNANAGVVFYLNVADAVLITTRTTITWNGQDYEVIAPPEIHRQGGQCDYGKVYTRILKHG
jgi:hypothetical protein